MLYLSGAGFELHWGDARSCLADVEPGSVQTIVTSPPYYDLRDYGTAAWDGGNPDCDHGVPIQSSSPKTRTSTIAGTRVNETSGVVYRDVCGRCGARRVDSQIGIEKTMGEYVENLVAVFEACKPVLHETGTVWLNLGDGNGNGDKPEGLDCAPWLTALALRDAGWTLRSTVIWAKTNAMPESVKNRPTDAHEYVFLLSRSDRYQFRHAGDGRHVRSIWPGPTASYKGAHVAVMPLWLARRCVLLTSRPGQTVLDPFAGSGTSLAAAVGYGRHAVGIDLLMMNCGQQARRIEESRSTVSA